MTTDWKALCAELVAWAEKTSSNYYKQADVLLRARAALAEQPVMPTDEELLHVAAISIEPYESSGIATGEYEPETECAVEVYGSELIAYARAILARWGNHPAKPNSSPADDEVGELVAWLKENAEDERQMSNGDNPASLNLDRAADLLQRLSPPQPVPVSERLPGPEDCEAGECWAWDVAAEAWNRTHYTHWLPAHALPLPEQEVSK